MVELIVNSKKWAKEKKPDVETAIQMLHHGNIPFSVLYECGSEAKIYTRQRIANTIPIIKKILIEHDLRKRIVRHFRKMKNIDDAIEKKRMERRKLFMNDKKSYMFTRMPSMSTLFDSTTPATPENSKVITLPEVEETLSPFKILLIEPLMERLVKTGLDLTLKQLLEGKEVDPVFMKRYIAAFSKPNTSDDET